jgi:hypothetical protein
MPHECCDKIIRRERISLRLNKLNVQDVYTIFAQKVIFVDILK